MRMPSPVPAVLLAALLIAPAVSRGDDKAEDAGTKIKELQKERLATLKELAEQMDTLFKHARVSFEETYEARVLLLEAELEIAAREPERIMLYKNFIDVLKGYEALAAERYRAARGTQAAVLKVKARRLAAEIELEREKMKEAREKK